MIESPTRKPGSKAKDRKSDISSSANDSDNNNNNNNNDDPFNFGESGKLRSPPSPQSLPKPKPPWEPTGPVALSARPVVPPRSYSEVMRDIRGHGGVVKGQDLNEFPKLPARIKTAATAAMAVSRGVMEKRCQSSAVKTDPDIVNNEKEVKGTTVAAVSERRPRDMFLPRALAVNAATATARGSVKIKENTKCIPIKTTNQGKIDDPVDKELSNRASISPSGQDTAEAVGENVLKNPNAESELNRRRSQGFGRGQPRENKDNNNNDDNIDAPLSVPRPLSRSLGRGIRFVAKDAGNGDTPAHPGSAILSHPASCFDGQLNGLRIRT